MQSRVENIVPGVNAECGCYEETCLIWPCEVTLHLEEDGTGDAFFEIEDYDLEKNFPASTIEELRVKAVEFVNGYFGG